MPEKGVAGPLGSASLAVHVDGEIVGGLHDVLVARAVRSVLSSEGVHEAEVSVTLLPDDEIRTLNREHLGHDRVTDVIAFPLWERGEPVVGDLCVGLEQARRQAVEAGVSLEEELARLVVHGMLHVLGWEHPEEPAARLESAMWRRQEELVRGVLEEDLAES
jgi:probable rRNA maturation factor